MYQLSLPTQGTPPVVGDVTSAYPSVSPAEGHDIRVVYTDTETEEWFEFTDATTIVAKANPNADKGQNVLLSTASGNTLDYALGKQVLAVPASTGAVQMDDVLNLPVDATMEIQFNKLAENTSLDFSGANWTVSDSFNDYIAEADFGADEYIALWITRTEAGSGDGELLVTAERYNNPDARIGYTAPHFNEPLAKTFSTTITFDADLNESAIRTTTLTAAVTSVVINNGSPGQYIRWEVQPATFGVAVDGVTVLDPESRLGTLDVSGGTSAIVFENVGGQWVVASVSKLRA
jgi:hypothetical protein